MYIAEVIGTTVATRKSPELTGMKLLILHRLDSAAAQPGKKNSIADVAVDSVGAGVGDKVLVATGTSARIALANEHSPVDAVIVGIIDSIEIR